jgi:hypothetical protein
MPRIEIQASWDAVLFSQNPFIYQPFISKRVHAADLEESWRNSFMPIWMIEHCI